MSLRTPQNTLQSMQNLLGACPQTPLHNPYYGYHFLYLPWAPPIPSVALPTITVFLKEPRKTYSSLILQLEAVIIRVIMVQVLKLGANA